MRLTPTATAAVVDREEDEAEMVDVVRVLDVVVDDVGVVDLVDVVCAVDFEDGDDAA